MHRAINQVPYCKALWLDSLRLFSSTLQEKDTFKLLDLMVEKEIRLRNDVEALHEAIITVEDNTTTGGGGGGSTQEGLSSNKNNNKKKKKKKEKESSSSEES